jgi:hypothetical protein
MSRTIEVPASRSVSTWPVNQNTPKVGSEPLPFDPNEAAARPFNVFPSNFSGWGW